MSFTSRSVKVISPANYESDSGNIVFYISLVLIGASFLMAASGHISALMSWWILISLLLPVLVWSLKTRHLAPKIFCLTAIGTQVITLPPFFLLNYEGWVWSDVNPFNFTVIETIPIIAKVSLFLISVIFFFRIFVRFTTKKKNLYSRSLTKSQGARPGQKSSFFLNRNKFSISIIALILTLICGLTILNVWSYSIGLGLTGVQPPRLPYRLAGIIFYFTKFVMPFVLAYLYSRTQRGWFLALLYLAYAWVFGLSAVSKGAVLIIMAPVIAFAWIDKRRWLFVFSAIGTLIGVAVASGARAYVHVVQNGVVSADTSNSVLELISSVLTDPNSGIWEFDYLPLLLVAITGRIEGFGNLVLAHHYDPYAVVGPSGFAIRMIWTGLLDFPTDAHHIEWTGSTLPDGFFSGGAILSLAVIMGNGGLWWVLMAGLITAAILVLCEKIVAKFVRRYAMFEAFKGAILFVLTMLLFTEATFSRIIVGILFFLIFATWIPQHVFDRLKRKRVLRVL